MTRSEDFRFSKISYTENQISKKLNVIWRSPEVLVNNVNRHQSLPFFRSLNNMCMCTDINIFRDICVFLTLLIGWGMQILFCYSVCKLHSAAFYPSNTTHTKFIQLHILGVRTQSVKSNSFLREKDGYF